ncbi:MAG: cytochrome-c peroxidase [Chitinophagaceae bacterium]
MRALKTILFIFSTALVMAWMLGACRSENPNNLRYVQPNWPDHFPAPAQSFAGNRFSEEGIELGRKLFYDGRLSKDGNYPCASCHQQIAGFGTFEHDRSHGYNGSHTLRNAPVLFNLAWYTSFHWDSAYSSLFHESAQPINDPIEMAENFESVIRKLLDDPDYPRLFRKVFHTDFIEPAHIQMALEQFTGSLLSANSKYDKFKRGEASFTTDELAGYALFQQHCAGCHPEPLFTDFSYRNIGLPVDPLLNDYGKMRVSGRSADSLKFRVPTLRNVDISSNYMHDGRFASLSQCLAHYKTGIQASPTLDPSLSVGIDLNAGETTQIIRFLRTLTDSSFLTNPLLARP